MYTQFETLEFNDLFFIHFHCKMMPGLARSASLRLQISPIVARVFSTQMKEVSNDSYAIEKLRNALNQYRREK
jgi:hypothetical protein